MTAIVVQKFGGSSVASPAHIERVADQILARRAQGTRLVVVVSAMAKTTDDLLSMARQIAPDPDRRELDMLVSVGERVSMALLAMAIRARGVDAVSLTGSQSGIVTTTSHTRARIMEVRPFRIQDELEKDRVVIVAGYQGVSYQREITTLGRGGSDTTAVALAAALGAEACEIYSDVDGVWTADPRRVPAARRIETLDGETMRQMALTGARVLHAEAVQYAIDHGIALYARKTGSDGEGTIIRRNAPVPARAVAVTHRSKVACLRFRASQAEAVLRGLADRGAWPEHVDVTAEGGTAVVALDDAVVEHGAWDDARSVPAALVSAIGPVFRDDPVQMWQSRARLESEGVEVLRAWSTPFSAHFVVERSVLDRGLSALHAHLGLDGEPSSIGP